MKLLDADHTSRTRNASSDKIYVGWILSGFLFLVFWFVFCVFCVWVLFVKRVWSVHRQLGFEPIFRQGGSNHELTSQRKSSFDWFSEKAGAGDIVFTLFKSKQLS